MSGDLEPGAHGMRQANERSARSQTSSPRAAARPRRDDAGGEGGSPPDPVALLPCRPGLHQACDVRARTRQGFLDACLALVPSSIASQTFQLTTPHRRADCRAVRLVRIEAHPVSLPSQPLGEHAQADTRRTGRADIRSLPADAMSFCRALRYALVSSRRPNRARRNGHCTARVLANSCSAPIGT
jgi:hypothetical protein